MISMGSDFNQTKVTIDTHGIDDFLFLVLARNVLQIIPLADEYQVTHVLDRCEKFLADLCDSIFEKNEKRKPVSVIVDYILIAEQHNLHRLLTSATRLCAKYNSDLVQQQERIEEVSYKTRYNIARERNVLFEKLLNELKSASYNRSSIPYEAFNLQPQSD
jgi:hypothetical protein